MQLILDEGNADFIFGLTGNAVLSRRAEGWMKNARGHLALHQSMHVQKYGPVVQSMRLFGEFEYAAKSWSQAHRVVLKAEVLAGSNGAPNKDNERFVVTTLRSPTPNSLYQQDYCGRGQAENGIKQVKCDLKSDRTSASTFIANFGRLLLTAAAYVLHQQLRQLGLQGTRLASAQPQDGHPLAVQNCRAGQTIQGSRAAPPACGLPGQINTGTGLSTTLPGWQETRHASLSMT